MLDFRARTRQRALAHVTFVGVTGSCGKSTTTKMIGAVLSARGNCQFRINEPLIDLPPRRVREAILSIDAATRYFVYETSGSSPGIMAQQLEIISPQIGVITTIGSDHRTTFRSLEATAQEKGILVERLPPSGVAILNIDDPYVGAMAARTKARVLTYGLSSAADIRGSAVTSAWPERLTLTVTHGDESVHVATEFVGVHWATSILAAVACGVACGLDLTVCAKAVASVEPVFARYSVHQKNGGPAYVLDSAKAPYWTIPPAVDFVRKALAPRKTIVFGTISDYAGNAGKVYRRVAREALAVADRLVFVGPHSGHVTRLRQREGATSSSRFRRPMRPARSAHQLLPNELIFIKGSRGADHLERIVLSQVDQVACWREHCGKVLSCHDCKHYRQPAPPPLGVFHQVEHVGGQSLAVGF